MVAGKDLGALGRVGGVGMNSQGYIYFLPESSLIVVDGLEAEHSEVMKNSLKES